ncbi:MAG: hypothetical protein CMF77_05740 [Candidatus Marinimicrobia bacterium]|nr:hypothetical protein [Candidatus Neomarinimicrobiota bacterium]
MRLSFLDKSLVKVIVTQDLSILNELLPQEAVPKANMMIATITVLMMRVSHAMKGMVTNTVCHRPVMCAI